MYALNIITAGDLVEAIEAETKRLGHDLTNTEMNDLVNKLVMEGKGQIISVHKDPVDLDLLSGNLREEGHKVRNLNEEIRKPKKNDKQD